MKKKLMAVVLSLFMLLGTFNSIPVCADAVPVITLGADLTQEQKEKVMAFFNTSEDAVTVITITNQDERKYLESLVKDDVIGTRTLSCSYILPQTSGGIVVKTANLTWVTDAMLANSLLTSGVENCQVLATAPFEVSGTGALTGVMMAYEKSSGEELDDSKKELATEELILTGELIDNSMSEYSEPSDNATISEGQPEESELVVNMLNDLKGEALNGGLTEDEIRALVEKYLEEYKIQITEELKQKLIDYLKAFTVEKYSNTVKESLNTLTENIKNGFDINVNVTIAFDNANRKVKQLCINIVETFKYIGGEDDFKINKDDIFNKINTDIFKLSGNDEKESSSTESE